MRPNNAELDFEGYKVYSNFFTQFYHLSSNRKLIEKIWNYYFKREPKTTFIFTIFIFIFSTLMGRKIQNEKQHQTCSVHDGNMCE